MGLSPDPEKRARQLENLGLGYPTARQRHGLTEPEPKPVDDDHNEPPAEPPDGLEVMAYDSPPEPPKPARARKPAGRKRRPARPAEPEPEPEPEPERRGIFGELGAGFFGG